MPGENNLLEMFLVLEEKPQTTQRHLSHHLGIALGMTNTLLRRAAKQGWLRVKKNNGRLSYHLTQQGLIEKGRLMMDQIQSTLKFYNEARQLARDCLKALHHEGKTSIVIRGTSNVSEIIYLTAKELQLQVVAFVDEKKRHQTWLDLPCLGFEDLDSCGAQVMVLDFLKKEQLESFEDQGFPCRSLIA